MAVFDGVKKAFGRCFELKVDLTAGRLYVFFLLCLVVFILYLAVMCSKQTQNRHAMYVEWIKAKNEYRTLKIEEQKLINEQQVFSSISLITERATNRLDMFYPVQKDSIVIEPPKQPKSSP